MLRFQHPRARPRAAAPRSSRERVTFGGVAFELLSREPLRHDLSGDDRRFWMSGVAPDAIADVVCSVHVEPGELPTGGRSNAIGFARVGPGRVQLWARTVSGELTRVGPGRYAAAVRIAADASSLVGMLRSVVASVVHLEGGLMLHTAAVELDGRAVLFLGPSGAGKSTAAGLTDGARCFAYDHAAVVPSGRGFVAWGLPGGTPGRAALAQGVAYPIAAALRVRKGPADAEPRATVLRGVPALFAVRESVECADSSPGAEDVYLHAVMKLASSITVGTLTTVLGRTHGAEMRAWLRAADAPAQEGRIS